jgi:hypothetical protein
MQAPGEICRLAIVRSGQRFVITCLCDDDRREQVSVHEDHLLG